MIPAFLRRQRNQRRLTLEMLSAKVGMSPQHLSEIESGKRDPRLSSIERMAEAMGMTVLIVPESIAPDLRRYVGIPDQRDRSFRSIVTYDSGRTVQTGFMPQQSPWTPRMSSDP